MKNMKLYTDNERKVVTKHPSCVEVGECRPPHHATKDTRRWCKGRVGIPHTWEWRRVRYHVEIEQRHSLRYNRITEEPVCFGCEKIDYRRRSYCAQCGEPWPNHPIGIDEDPVCPRCRAPWQVRLRRGGTWKPSGSVVA